MKAREPGNIEEAVEMQLHTSWQSVETWSESFSWIPLVNRTTIHCPY